MSKKDLGSQYKIVFEAFEKNQNYSDCSLLEPLDTINSTIFPTEEQPCNQII